MNAYERIIVTLIIVIGTPILTIIFVLLFTPVFTFYERLKEQLLTPIVLSIHHRLFPNSMSANRRSYDSFANLPLIVSAGLLLYRTAESGPVVYRPGMATDSYEFCRPFAVFDIEHRTIEDLTFELKTRAGRRLFSSTHPYALEPGQTPVGAFHWFRLRDAPDDVLDWELCIYTGSILLYSAVFRTDSGGGRFRQYLNGDGELSDQLLAVLDEPSLKEKLSLDELLG